MPTPELMEMSYTDLSDDLSELQYLARDLVNKLNKFTGELKNKRKFIEPGIFVNSNESASRLKLKILEISADIQSVAVKLSTTERSEQNFREFVKLKYSFYSRIRSITGIVAANILATDWQSPTFNYSLYSMAGRQTGLIMHSLNDYKRDQHLDSHHFERKFVGENVENPLGITIGCFATSSGMSACSTIINYLLKQDILNNKYVIAGKCVYFETLRLLKSLVKNKLILVDETDTKAVIAAIRGYEPAAIFLDTIANSEKMPVTDMESIIREINQNSRNTPYLVIDNTITSIKFQPLKKILISKKINFILFESLNKYHQFGLDRVTGGIIYFKCKSFENIIEFRDHLGTIIPDINTVALPTPNRKILNRRLNRISRNALILAKILDDRLTGKSRKIRSIIYPGLPNHPGFRTAQQYEFTGPYFNLDIFERFMTVTACKNMINQAIKLARKSNLQIVEGTSFGLPCTRLYLTDVRSIEGNLFFRISPGTETISEIYRIADVLCQAFF
jgi:cystathionine beta-lyase/cystathionine gamma-synthase